MLGCGWWLGQQGFLDAESFNMCFLIVRLIYILSTNILSYFVIFHSNSHSLLFFLTFFLVVYDVNVPLLTFHTKILSRQKLHQPNQPISHWFDFVFVLKVNQTKLYTFFYLVIKMTFNFKTELNCNANTLG